MLVVTSKIFFAAFIGVISNASEYRQCPHDAPRPGHPARRTRQIGHGTNASYTFCGTPHPYTRNVICRPGRPSTYRLNRAIHA
jgi:hypothetical protein